MKTYPCISVGFCQNASNDLLEQLECNIINNFPFSLETSQGQVIL